MKKVFVSMVGVQIRYNWLHDTEKFGARFDGEGDGYGGHMHHNVIWNVQVYNSKGMNIIFTITPHLIMRKK